MATEQGSGADVEELLRGFCHACAREVVPCEVETDAFECEICHEQCVECPYESFEHWQGEWLVSLDDGQTSTFSIDDQGAVRLANGAEAQLRWAPRDHAGHLMRMASPFFETRGMRLHIGLGASSGQDADAPQSLIVRHEIQDGTIICGTAERPSAGSPQEISVAGHPHALSPDPRETHFCDLCRVTGTQYRCASGCDFDVCAACAEGEAAVPHDSSRTSGSGARRAFNQGLDQWLSQFETIPSSDRRRLRRQLRHLLPLLNATGGLPGGNAASGAPNLDFPNLMRLIMEGHGNVFDIRGDDVQSSEDPGVPEGELHPWLDAHACASISDSAGGEEWECAICFDNSQEELIAVCQDEDGKAVHVYHRGCIADWLVRRNECPTCRKTPLVGLSE